MISIFLSQLSALGIPSEKLPSDELNTKLESGEPSFTIDVQPDNDPTYLITLYYTTPNYTIPGDTLPPCLTQLVGTLYDPVTNDIDKCHPFLVKDGRSEFSVSQVKNLLAGRCVAHCFRQHTPFGYDKWYHLDFETRGPENAYRLVTTRFSVNHYIQKVLALYPIIEMEDPAYPPIILEALAAGERIQIQLREGKQITPKLIQLHPAGRIRFNRTDKASATFDIQHKKAELLCPTDKTSETLA